MENAYYVSISIKKAVMAERSKAPDSRINLLLGKESENSGTLMRALVQIPLLTKFDLKLLHCFT